MQLATARRKLDHAFKYLHALGMRNSWASRYLTDEQWETMDDDAVDQAIELVLTAEREIKAQL